MPQIQLIFEKQWLHILALAGLIAGLVLLGTSDSFQAGSLLGVDTMIWFRLAVAIAITHQVLVWFCWRTQLHLSLLTRLLGDNGFTVYAVLFSIFGIARVVAVFILAIANRNTIPLELAALRILAVLMAIPAVYLFYSVKRYFGFKRAFGVDHFDPSYRSLPFVKKGIFRFTSNGMYTFGFFLLWVPGLWYGSIAALCAALFNHLYIWIHYYSTELPDIKRIYG
ncbi:hypothetical protein D1BOALGB6SA_8866 [Olavius sp. associated proteobacterium Delta 1]|nr:hypothetical protein D1BOALGB6SA_8866 [Olavius sp. associated proteobacterium Delta 1]